MPTLRAHGIESDLPRRFEGRIFSRPTAGLETPSTVAQFSTFPLPEDVGDFGGGAVTLMGATDVFATLFEYGPDSLGTRLFARQGMPRRLGTGDFRPYVLRRGLPGQAGTQWFFTEGGRPFTLYVVLGSHARRAALLPDVNQLLAGIRVGPAVPVPAPTATGVPWN